MGFQYGTEYTREEINRALMAEMPQEIVPTTDENGHGTQMASVAAGSILEEGLAFRGAAPKADIAVVKVKGAKQYLRNFYLIDDEAVAFQENDIMEAVNYLQQMAIALHRPVVIVLGIGTNYGNHNGTSPLAAYLSDIAKRRSRAVVVCSGNEGDKEHHYEGDISSAAEIRVEERMKGFCMEIWCGLPDTYTVTIRSPGGEVSPEIDFRDAADTEVSFIFEKSRIIISNILVESNGGEQLIFLRVDNPTGGIWAVQVAAENGKLTGDGRYHIWLPIENFLERSVTFLAPSPEVTLTEPANAERVITVSAYRADNDTWLPQSGRGYTKNGIIKPELSAPGYRVSTILGEKTGSCMAAAITAGCVAQFMEWAIVEGNDILVESRDIKSYLIRGAERTSGIIYPDRRWGDNGIIVSDQASQGNHNPEPAAFSGKIIKGIMFFAESHNGACSNPVICSVGIGQSVPSKGDLSLIRVFNLKHESRLMDTTDDNFSFIFRELFTGFYGIFQSVGKADGKFCRIDGEYFRNGKMELHGDPRFFCLTQISSERGI